MFRRILVPIDLGDQVFAKPGVETAVTLARVSGGVVRLLSVLPVTPVMLSEYIPADFDAQQQSAVREALDIVARESGLDPGSVSTVVRQGSVHHEVIEEAAAMDADLIVMASHRPGARTYVLGSTAAHVVRHAKCSVLVLRR